MSEGNFTSRPTVSWLISAIEHACFLASGVKDCSSPAPPSVPNDNLLAASVLASNVNEELKKLLLLRDRIPGGLGGLVADQMVSSAQSDIRTLADLISGRAQSHSIASPVDCRLMKRLRAGLIAAKDYFEVLSGERAFGTTEAGFIDENAAVAYEPIIETTIMLIPIIGPCYSVSMAVWGKTLTGQPRSTTERWILGVTAIIGPALKAIRYVDQAYKVSKTAMLANKLKLLGRTNIDGLQTVADINRFRKALRPLRPDQIKLLEETVAKVETFEKLKVMGKVAPLSSETTESLHFLLMRMSEEIKVAEWLKVAEQRTGQAVIQGRQITDIGKVNFKLGEKEVGEILAKELNLQVFHLPETQMFVKEAGNIGRIKQATRGIKWPDLIIDGELADIVRPSSLASKIGKKSDQAGTIVVDLVREIDLKAFIKQLDKTLWGNALAADAYQVIIVQGGKVTKLARPDIYRFLQPTAVGAARTARAILENSDAVDRESD